MNNYSYIFNQLEPVLPAFRVIGVVSYINNIVESIMVSEIQYTTAPIYGIVSTELHIELLIFPKTSDEVTILKMMLN